MHQILTQLNEAYNRPRQAKKPQRPRINQPVLLRLSFATMAVDENGEPYVCLWNVNPTGRYNDDCRQGQKYANELIDYLGRNSCPNLLAGVVKAVFRRGEWSGLENGLLHRLAEVLIWKSALHQRPERQ